ncbi:hypothetical protein BH23THE1_BH23THE1_35580 [soil metagenome]
MIIFSSSKILRNILGRNDFINHFHSLLRSGVKIKILIDNEDNILLKQINTINDTNRLNTIQLNHSNKMIEFSECVIISDDKYILQSMYDRNNQLVAFFSTEKYNILLQEILFEKHWNEVESLASITRN